MGNCFNGENPNVVENKIKFENEQRFAASLEEREREVLDGVNNADNLTPLAPTFSALEFESNTRGIGPVDKKALDAIPEKYTYPIENLVFEGGGGKILAHIGAIKYMEELCLIPDIKRFGGSGGGAIIAALLALGYRYTDIKEMLPCNLMSIYSDNTFRRLTHVPNIFTHYGVTGGNKIYNWLGQVIKSRIKSRNPDLTFYELYKEKKIELCVAVTNLSLMRVEYFHPKTTPDMPIREGLMTSISVPGVFTARTLDNHGQIDTYVDGGLLTTFPLTCFDGWYLSMDLANSFLFHLRSLNKLPTVEATKNKFNPPNEKTIGFSLQDDIEAEIMKPFPVQNLGSLLPEKPTENTKLYKEAIKKQETSRRTTFELNCNAVAVEAFLRILQTQNLDQDEYLYVHDLKQALADSEIFSFEEAEVLLGKDINFRILVKMLDPQNTGKIVLLELIWYIQEHGIRMKTRMDSHVKRYINSFEDYWMAIHDTLIFDRKRELALAEEKRTSDDKRTVNINTGHIQACNWIMEEEDKDFLIIRGYNATKAFFRYYVARHPKLPIRNMSAI